MRDDTSMNPRIHGGVIESELKAFGIGIGIGIGIDEIVDFSVNTNPYGPCPSVVAAARAAVFSCYPDPSASLLRAAIAAEHELDPAQVVVGNGAADLLWTLARVLLKEREPVVVVEPTFSEFRAAALAAGAKVSEWRAQASQHFAMDLQAIGKQVIDTHARAIYVASPNTPTGAVLPAAEIAEFALEHASVTIILDQSFLMLSDRWEDFRLPMPDNVIRVRSLTKDHTIPGLRIGYLLAGAQFAHRVEFLRPVWTTNAVAQAAGLAAIKERNFVLDSWRKMESDCKHLSQSLRNLGLAPFPTHTAFFVMETSGGAELRTRLLRRGILVRDCASFGLPAFIRISARPEADNQRLIAALEQELR